MVWSLSSLYGERGTRPIVHGSVHGNRRREKGREE